MRVFVTGATGWIGKAVVKELLGAGHQISGLARSDSGAELLAGLGAEVLRGSLDNLDSLKKGASESEGIIHLAFIEDFSDFPKSCQADRTAIETMGSVLAGSNRPLIIASGTLLLPHGRLATEADPYDSTSPFFAVRGASEATALSLASQGVRAMVMRLAPTNHGDGDKGFIPRLIAIAQEKGVSAYVGDGQNRWPAVHRLDTARLFRLALEKGKAGSRFHAVGEESVHFKDIAEVIGKQLNVPVVSKPKEEAQDHFGLLAFGVAEDNPVSSAITREQLGWNPTGKGLLADLKEGSYFKK